MLHGNVSSKTAHYRFGRQFGASFRRFTEAASKHQQVPTFSFLELLMFQSAPAMPEASGPEFQDGPRVFLRHSPDIRKAC